MEGTLLLDIIPVWLNLLYPEQNLANQMIQNQHVLSTHPHAPRNSTSFRMSSADLAAVNFKSRRISSPTEYAC